MSFFTSLIPPPYSVIARIVAPLLVALAGFGYGWTKGVDHQQAKDAVVHAQQIAAAETMHQKQEISLRAISTQYEQESADAQAHAADLNDALSRALRVRQCPASAYSPAGVPSNRSGAAGAPGAASVDARFGAAVQHDASHYAGCAIQLNALVDAVEAANGNKP